MNNLKAERTLTAEELQAIIDGCEKATPGPWFEGDKWVFVSPHSGEATHALENIFRDVPEAQENCLYVSRLDPETVKAMASMAIQSLSTQQPMGEPVAWMHTLHMEHGQTSVSVDMEEEHPYGEAGEDYDPSYFVTSTPLYALHPNQESGE